MSFSSSCANRSSWRNLVRHSISTSRLFAGVLLLTSAMWTHGRSARAQSTQTGFTLNRYEPTAAGEWSFSVDHPWYSSTRYFAGGITLNYGHNPLRFGPVVGDTVEPAVSVIEHQLLGHVDLAGSFLDRVLLTATLPVTLLERGTPTQGVTPTEGVVVGDPRLGLWVRLFGQPYRSGISMSIGANVWIPLRQFTNSGVSPSSSDSFVRVLPKLALGGIAGHFMWSFTGGFLYRAPARLGNADPAGSSVGSEVQFGLALGYANLAHRFAILPEATLATMVMGNDDIKPQPFAKDYTTLELLLGFHVNIARVLNLSLGGGLGVLRTPGTPDGRALLRLSYAPMRNSVEKPKDRDNDGIADDIDACPDQAGIPTSDARTNGCPDRDHDQVVDKIDQCPDQPMGVRPDPTRTGCPLGDRDHDGIYDVDDQCPLVPQGSRPDPERTGCPLGDRDHDGVLDPDDLCPDVPQGDVPDPERLGCPAGDRDQDGVLDPSDRCPDVPQGTHPDKQRPGCPVPDRDGDTVVDPDDACPDKPGAPNVDPKKNGCPSLVSVQSGKLVIVQPVFFATNKDIILQKSYPVLQSVADALTAAVEIRRVAIEGHTDNRGKPEYNRDLSYRRARSVMRWLVAHGIDESRLEVLGFGPDRPITSNDTPQGRERNRRVEFVIIDPPQSSSVRTIDASQAEVPSSPDQSDTSPASQGKVPKKGK